MKTDKQKEDKILEAFRRRVIEKDSLLKEKQKQAEILTANKQALKEITNLSPEELDQIEQEVRTKFIGKALKRRQALWFLALGVVILLIATAWFWYDHYRLSKAPDFQTVLEDTKIHHLGDNPGNEGSTYKAEFHLENRRAYRSAVLSIGFTEWGPNTNPPPSVSLNGHDLGSVFEGLSAPGTDDCWEGPASDGSYDYNCDFTYQKDVYQFLKSGTNTFEISCGKPSDDFKFKLLKIEMRKTPKEK